MTQAPPSAQRVYAMLGNETLWETAALCHRLFDEAGIPHTIVGGVAVCLHGYRRNTVDVDLLVRREDADGVRRVLEGATFEWLAESGEFRSPGGVVVQILLAGDDAGAGLRVPDPQGDRVTTTIEDLPVLTLERLIELKLACGLDNVRRTHKDFADVVELIIAHDLSRSFACHLHKPVRPAFRKLVVRARGEG